MKRKPNHSHPPKPDIRVSTSQGCSAEMVTSADSNTASNSQMVPEPTPQKRHLLMSQHSQNLVKFLNEDRTRQRFCDVCVSVGGRLFHAHKVVLAHGSSYFHAELSKNPATEQVTLDHVEGSVFQCLLGLLYSSECVVTDRELPALTEAARFLDMIDVLKLLVGDGNTAQVPLHQVQVMPSVQSLPAESKEVRRLECSLCSLRFCSGKSLENHLARSHGSEGPAGFGGGEKVVGRETVTTRRSARRRRAPAKYSREDLDGSGGDPAEKRISSSPTEEDGEKEEEVEDAVKKQKSTSHARETPPPPIQGQDVEEEEEEGEERDVGGDGGWRTAGQQKEVSVCAADGGGCQQRLEEETNQQQAADETGTFSPSTESSGNATVYPKDLAPVIIHTSSRKTLKCPKCDKTFDRAGKYVSHTRVHTGEKPFQCDVCLQCYSTKSNLTVHKKKHASDLPFQKKEHKCPFCNKLHASKKTLAKHVRRFHPDHNQEFLTMRKRKTEGWKCATCFKTFTRRPHLEEHMILHTQDRPFKCTFCDEHFRSRFARLKHQEKYHLGPFPCEICGRQFNDTGNRKRHIDCTHGGKRKWTCFVCGKSMRERTTLREHLRIHSGEKPHLCSICGQSFRHGSSYRLHLRVHHDDKRYECDECGKTFIRHDHLTKHQKIHSGEKAHQCEECGKCFRRHDHLTVHYKSVHLGEKVWQKYKSVLHQCEVCKKEFKGKSSLEMHFRTHSGEKPYKCPECHQTFRIKKTLTKHMVIHSDARPFNCPHCSATFKRKDKLKYHMDHVHSAKFTEQSAAALSQDRIVPLPYEETPKVFRLESKSVLQSSPAPANVCVPVTLVPVQMAGPQGGQANLIPSQTHSVLTMQTQGQQQASGFQAGPDLAFLEKYTLTPQPANIVHPVRADQMLDPREQSYLGTLLGLDSAPTVQNMSSSAHTH